MAPRLPSRVRAALLPAACALVCARPAVAQRPRVAVEPLAGAAPAAALWRRTAAVQERRYDGAASGFSGERREVTVRTTVVTRDAAPLVGLRVVVAGVRSPWRLALEGSAGRGELLARTRERWDAFGTASDGTPYNAWHEVRREEWHPVAVAQVALHAERAARVRGVALEWGAGALAQHLRTRRLTWRPGPPSSPFGEVAPERRAYVDPGVRVGAAVGPARGPWSGARLAVRSAHVWRSATMANDYGSELPAPLDASGRRWQWQPEVAVSWRLWIGPRAGGPP